MNKTSLEHFSTIRKGSKITCVDTHREFLSSRNVRVKLEQSKFNSAYYRLGGILYRVRMDALC